MAVVTPADALRELSLVVEDSRIGVYQAVEDEAGRQGERPPDGHHRAGDRRGPGGARPRRGCGSS